MDKNILSVFRHTSCLTTDRLLLRKMRKKDAADMYDYAKRMDVTRYLLWQPHSDLAFTKRYLSYVESCYRTDKFYDLAVVYRAEDRMIGTCGFTRFDFLNHSAEIGYVLHPRYWNLGIATEAVCAVLRYGFETLGLNRIEARYMKDNMASRRVMEKCGMTFEGIQRSAMLIKGKYEDIGLFAKLRDD